MKVKKGYKLTEVGVIPEDWDCWELKSLTDASAPIRYGVVQIGPHVRGGVPIIPIKYLKNINPDILHHCSAEIESKFPGSRVEENDVLVSVKGTIGRVGIVPKSFAGNIAREIARIRPASGESSKYISYQLEAPATQSRILDVIVGTTRLEFSIAAVRSFQIPLPPTLAEQEAIAGALSDTDALIESLEQLIAKKRLIKQGTMQDLLTAKKRLPGFTEDWETYAIKDALSQIWDYRGRTPRKLGMDWGGGNIKALSAANVRMGGIDFEIECYEASQELYENWMNRGDLLKGDIIMTTEAPLGNVAQIPDKKKYILSQRVIMLRGDELTVGNNFLSHFLGSPFFQKRLQEDSSGSTAKGIQRLKFEKIEITLPPLPEQTAIARILSDMDAELESLAQKLAKTRQLKQGMMQELLTGKTRLV